MTALWLAVLAEDPGGASIAPVTERNGRPAGYLCLWRVAERSRDAALQADPRLLDESGPRCVISLALADDHARPIADDPAVVEARRAVLRDGRPRAVTLLTSGPVTIAGAMTIARADHPMEVAALADDPFARLWPARLLHVAPGLLGAPVRPTGPTLERYGGRPWPYDVF